MRHIIIGLIKILVASVIAGMAYLIWYGKVTPFHRFEYFYSQLRLFFLVLPVLIPLVFSIRRQHVIFDVFAPFIILALFFLSLEGPAENERWFWLVYSGIFSIFLRELLSYISFGKRVYTMFHVVIVVVALGVVAYYGFEDRVVANNIVKFFAVIFVLPVFLSLQLYIPHIVLLAFPIYAFSYCSSGCPRNRFIFAISLISFPALACCLLPLREIAMKELVDPCYMDVGDYYHESPYRTIPKSKTVCAVRAREGNRGVNAFREFPVADYDTFEDLGQSYAKDKNHIFYKDKILDADHATFEKVGNYGCAVDRGSVFFYGKRINETYTFAAEDRNFRLQFPKQYDNYSIKPYRVKFTNECHGETYSRDHSYELGYSVSVLEPDYCRFDEKPVSEITKAEVSGVTGIKYLTEKGYEITEIEKGGFRYIIKKKGNWHEKMLPKFSFINSQ